MKSQRDIFSAMTNLSTFLRISVDRLFVKSSQSTDKHGENVCSILIRLAKPLHNLSLNLKNIEDPNKKKSEMF